MRIKTDNGNVTVHSRQEVSNRNTDNRSWLDSNLRESKSTDYIEVSNYNSIHDSRDTPKTLENYATETQIVADNEVPVLSTELVCNRQYRINSRNVNTVGLCDKTETDNLEGIKEPDCDPRERLDHTNVYIATSPLEEDRPFDHSDADEMSETRTNPVPRGIVNPNYPGFQHLAHTLQDYSSNIENFYHSDNEMTDDDVDIEITDLAYEAEPCQIGTIEYRKPNTNNNTKKDLTIPQLLSSQTNWHFQTKQLDSQHIEIPDLIKTVSQNNNNNNEIFNYEINCTDAADIENNFHTKDIIGDFNKEIEEEIKQLLNYNINIQDDLEELRKDIKDTFTKPIESTINNISDVVNHVIKKLVETQSECADENEESKSNHVMDEKTDQEINKINKENEKNARTEMSLSRPTFLIIDNKTDGQITDAFLSDGKDEINTNEYDTEKLSLNVENTIKQLSTELRKIIPKLDEMRERDRLWAECKRESVIIDGNSNEIANTSRGYSISSNQTQSTSDTAKITKRNDNHVSENHYAAKSPTGSKTENENQKETKTSCRNAQNKTSVRKNANRKDLDLESFDVYNIETALPKLDLDAIENHLKAAKEAERRVSKYK